MLSKYLYRHWPSVLTGNILALLLGVVAALVGVMIGPAIQLLMNADDTVVIYAKDLFGPRLAPWIVNLTGISQITASEFLWQLPGILIILAGAKAVFALAQWFTWERCGELISKEMRSDLMEQYVLLNPAIRGRGKNEIEEEGLSTVLSTDIKLTREYIVRFYGGLPREGLQVIFMAVTLILLSPKLFALFAFALAPALIIITRLGKKLRKRTSLALQDYSDLAEWLQQRLRGIETIKHSGTEVLEQTKMASLNESMYRRFLQAARVKARISPLIEAVSVLGIVVVIYFALKQVKTGEVSGAVQLSFFSTLALLSQAANKLGHYYNSNREGSAAISRIETIMTYLQSNTLAHVARPTIKHSDQGVSLNLKNIELTYQDAKQSALRDFSFNFEGGKIYCLVGPSGAGKSSLFKAILGLAPLSKGEIVVSLPKAHSYMDNLFAYMPQKVMLAPVSVNENVAYPSETFDSHGVRKSIDEVGLKSVIEDLDQSYETSLGSEGRALSGGQAQRVQLARICYHKNPIVLVDEGTSALDPESEKVIYGRLREMADEGRLVIMIAHRQSATRISDEILQLEKGQLVAHRHSESVPPSF